MSNLKETMLSIVVTKDHFYDNDDDADNTVSSEYKFLNELKSAIDILVKAEFEDIEPTIGMFEPREDTEVTNYIDISTNTLDISSIYYDDNGDYCSGDEGSYNITDFDEHQKIFNQVKDLFDPTPQPILANVWNTVDRIRIERDQVTFFIGDFENDKLYED